MLSQEERAVLGYNKNDAVLVSIPLSVLAFTLAVLLWRLAAPRDDPAHAGSLRDTLLERRI